MKKKLMACALVALMALSLVGCGNKAAREEAKRTTEAVTEAEVVTIESIVSEPSNKKQITDDLTATLNDYSAYYTDITFDAKQNDIYYNYYFTESYETSDAVYKSFEDSDWDATISQVKAGFQSEYKITPSSITYSYYTYNGDLFFSVTK